nr:hypothetical protein [Tanacetum cinerariifolium]
ESGSIIVVVDRFSKYEMFIAAPPDVTADDTSKLFFKNVVKYWGVPHVIVSDQDPRRANGEGERTIGALSLALWKSPFELVTGRQPLTPNALAASYEGSSPTAYKTTKEWHEQADMARESLDKATKRMKKWAEERRRHVEFEVGDQVMVHKGLIRRYEGPFPVIGRVGKPYHGDEEDPERRVSKRAPTTVVTSYDREVEEILSDRTIRRRGVPSYKDKLGSERLIVAVCGRDQEISRGWHNEDVASLGGGGCHAPPDFTRLARIPDCSTLN